VVLYAITSVLPDSKLCKQPKNIVSDNFLVVYKILDLAKLMLLQTALPCSLHSKAEVTQKDYLVMIPTFVRQCAIKLIHH
jgi:hypothetical protein